MKSRVLSIVLSLVMVFGVSAGSAYAETDDSRDGKNYDIKDKLARYCDMTDEEKAELVAKHNKSAEHQELMNQYCELAEEDREAFIEEHKEKYKMKYSKDIRDKLARYCEMSDEEKQAFLAKHEKAEDHAEKMNQYCELAEEDREAFIEEHKDEYKSKMKAKMDKVKGKHLDYDRLCALSESERVLEFDDPKKLERISNWCNMTIEEREDYKRETHDSMKEHKKFMRASSLTDEQKADIRAKHAELKEYKNSLKEQSDLSEEQRKELREEFIDKAKSMKVSWISPRHQVAAGIDAENVECREGFDLVMKVSNGNPLCLKERTAAKLVEKGIVQAI